jgi:transcriptional regulator with XRE-family HTH domain
MRITHHHRQGDHLVTLGDKLQMLRLERGWSQRELARRAMVRAALLSQLERNLKRDTTGRVLRRLALVLHVSTDYLLGMYDGLDD